MTSEGSLSDISDPVSTNGAEPESCRAGDLVLPLPQGFHRTNQDVATILLHLASDLLRETHPAVADMIRYALAEISEDARSS